MSSSAHPTLPIGQMLSSGRYKVIKKLGEGGYGSVYLAGDTRLAGRKVAIKELHDPSPDSRQLFQREATLLASLSHPGLVRVSDYFEEGGSSFLAMDYIDGRDLLDMAIEADKANRLLPADKVAGWMIQVCEAVAYLHHRQPPVIHRDIKPGNIRLNSNQDAILVDFGIAKIDPKAKTHMMAKAVSVGFSPPEQYAGAGGTDLRSDVYALGATLYCLLTVQPPPDGFERLTEDKPLPPPRQFNKAISSQLEAVVLKAMALNSLQRYQDADDLLVALRSALGKSAAQPYLMPITPPVSPPSSAATVKCPKCGHSCRAGAKFCPKCRYAFSGARCPKCGTAARPGAKFCARCRTALSAGAASPDCRQIDRHIAQGDQHAKGKQFDRAASEYEQALKLGGSTAHLFEQLGQCYVQLDRFDDAIEVLEKGARQHSTHALIHLQLALAYLGAQKLSQGLQTFELAHQLAPDDDELALLLTGVYFDFGRQAKAQPILENLHRRQPRHEVVRYRLGVCYLGAGRLNEAERLVKDLQRDNPDSAQLYFLLGLLHHKRGHARQALKDLQAAVQRDPSHALAYEYMGDIYFAQKKWKDAVGAFEKAALANPRDADPPAKLCLCYMEMKKPNDAVAALERAAQIDPGNQLVQKIMQMLGS